MISGIYQIRCVVTNKKYIGSSYNVLHRLKTHFKLLKKNSHYNKYLQNAYNKYGFSNFEYSVLMSCNVSELRSEETKYISMYDKKELYNIKVVDAFSNLGMHCATRKLKKSQVRNIIKLIKSGYTKKEVAILYKISAHVITLILNRITYKDCTSEIIPFDSKAHYKLKDSDIPTIVNLLNNNATCKEIAKIYNVDKTLIQIIKRGGIWKHHSINVRSDIKYKKGYTRKIAVYNDKRELLFTCDTMIETSNKTGINYNTINTSARRKTLCCNQFYFEKI